MATIYKVLGQSAPAAATATTLYTVPSATNAVISSLIVANRDAGAATFNIAIRPSGASLANQHYIAFQVTISGGDSTVLTLGLTMTATDVITVLGSTANLTFSVYGTEIN